MGNVPRRKRRKVFVARKSEPPALLVLQELERAGLDVIELESFKSINKTPGIDFYAVTKHPRPSAPVAIDVIEAQKYVLFDAEAGVTADQVLLALGRSQVTA